MRSFRKQQDTEATAIRFGIELETKIPRISGIAVGGYHNHILMFEGWPLLVDWLLASSGFPLFCQPLSLRQVAPRHSPHGEYSRGTP